MSDRVISFGRVDLRPLVVALLLSACVGTPAYQPPAVRVSPAFDVAASTARPQSGSTGSLAHSAEFRTNVAIAPFWRDLGDSALTELVRIAQRSSTSVQAAESRLTSARAARHLAMFDLAPTVNAVGSATRQQQSIAQIPGLTSQLPRRDLYDVGFDASWEVDLFGRVRRNVSAQGAFEESAEHDLDGVQVSLASEVARTYFELRGAEQQLAVARRNADNQRKIVALTEDRLTAGRGTAFDTERARSVLQLTLAGIPTIEAQIAAQRYRLAMLIGRAPDALPSSVLAAGSLPKLPDTLDVGSPRDVVRHRPDVLGAERQLAAQSLFVSAARADYLPRLSIGASAGYAATEFGSLTRQGTSRVLVGPIVSLPLLDVGRIRQRVGMAEAHQEEARARYSATVLQAMTETETALVSYDRAHARVAILGEAVRASARAAELAQQRFEAGLTDFLQVLDAQRTLLDAENQLAQSQTAAVSSLVAVYKAVGGTWPIK